LLKTRKIDHSPISHSEWRELAPLLFFCSLLFLKATFGRAKKQPTTHTFLKVAESWREARLVLAITAITTVSINMLNMFNSLEIQKLSIESVIYA